MENNDSIRLPQAPPYLVLRDAAAGQWLLFRQPCECVETRRLDEVADCLRRVESLVQDRGLFAAGFVSYEAAPAFDRALTVRDSTDFPLLWFGLFPRAETIDLSRCRPAVPNPPHAAEAWQPSMNATVYEKVIDRVRAAIAAGETYQVNYTFRLSRPFDGDPWSLFLRLMNDRPPPYAAYVETEQHAICSASPELFFDLDGTTIISRPMKGTIARGRWYEEDLARSRELAASEKNRAENAMIVDMMRNDLGRIARRGSVVVGDLFRVERYPTLWQMTSRVAAETDASLAEIFSALFPCASVTGAPKASTMRIIAQLETTPRRVYTGSIGMMAPGRRARFNVAIRTAIVDKTRRQADYGVGGGVVWDSTPQGEYDECLLKAKVLTARRPEFSLLETMLWTPLDGYELLGEHILRLRQSAEYFGFPLSTEAVFKALEARAKLLPKVAHRVRLLVDRNGNTSCEATPHDDSDSQNHIRLELAAAPVDASDVFLYHKTTYRAVYAAAQTSCTIGDDVLLYNRRGEVTETSRANVVVRCGSDHWTPPVACGLLAGTYRARLLAEGTIRERIVPLAMLVECDELLFINSVRGRRTACLVGPRDPKAVAAGLREVNGVDA